MDHKFEFVTLHDAPDLLEEAAKLLNSEWPRTLEARCYAIKSSSNELPCSFLLLKLSPETNGRHVVGYCHLCKVLGKPKSVLIESVIVDKMERGHGLGRMVMSCAEDFARKSGYKEMYLSTSNKKTFYQHLGYSVSSPVSPETKVTRFLSQCQVDTLGTQFQDEIVGDPVQPARPVDNYEKYPNTVQSFKKSCCQATSLPKLPPVAKPPPPLPPPPPSLPPCHDFPEHRPLKHVSAVASQDKKVGNESRISVWMKKIL